MILRNWDGSSIMSEEAQRKKSPRFIPSCVPETNVREKVQVSVHGQACFQICFFSTMTLIALCVLFGR